MELRSRLRDETKTAHQQLDHSLGKLGVFESISHYAVYLSGLHQLYALYGSEIDWASDRAGIVRSVADLQSAIENDLSHSVLPPVDVRVLPPVDVRVLPPVDVRVLPPVDVDWSKSELQNPANGWAAAYVMEGSAMGARYMVKEVEASALVASGEIQITYLKKLAADSYERWPKLVAALEAADCDVNQAVDAAKAVFRTASDIFEKAIDRHNRIQQLMN